MSFLTNIQLGSNVAPGGTAFTMNRYVNAAGFKLVINGTGTEIFELTTGAAGATRRFSWAASGQYTMDAYGSGTFTGTATRWLAVTAAGIVIEETPPTGTTITANNGLNMSTATNVQLGGPLVVNTTITTTGFNFTITGSRTSSGEVVSISNSNANSVPALAVQSTSSNNYAANVQNTGTGPGLRGMSLNGGVGVRSTTLHSSTNTTRTVISITRETSGTAAANIGGAFDFEIEKDDGNLVVANRVISILTTVTAASPTSTMTLTGLLAAASVDLLVLAGDGSVKLRPITATAASAITPAEGMIVFTSDTDGTFTAVGFWGYENGAWAKL